MRNQMLSGCFAPADQWEQDGFLTLDPEESRHLARVLHAKPDDRVEAFDGEGRRAVCRVIEIGKSVRLRVEDSFLEPEPAHRFRLIVGMPKENKMEWLLQKGTELGMFSITVFQADRSVVRLAPEAAERRRLRWERILRDAAKQSGRSRLPLLDFAPDLHSVLERAVEPSECRLVCSLEAPPGSLRDALREAWAQGARDWAALLGPAGDFSPEEMAALRRAHIREVSLCGGRFEKVDFHPV